MQSSASSATIPENRVLPKKEKDIFQSLHRCYEKKDYHNGLKQAEIILKSHPNHGETLAMKGLMIHTTGKKEEGFQLAKLGLRNDVQSHVCWHVLGLIHRTENNYKEASKCYLNALRIDPGNQLILRDLSWLQIHLRDYVGFLESRRRNILLKPGLKANWVAYISANYFAGYYEAAIDLIKKFQEAWSPDPQTAYEESELILFQNQCLEKLKRYPEAISHLETNSDIIVDKFYIRIKSAELLILSSQWEAAKNAWTSIVNEFGENYRFHGCLQMAYLQVDVDSALRLLELKRLELPSNTLNLSSAQRETLRNVYISNSFPSRAAEKILLELAEPDSTQFVDLLDKYIVKRVRDGVPSLFQDIKALCRIPDQYNPEVSVYIHDSFDYKQSKVVKVANELIDKHILSLQSTGRFNCCTEEEEPTSLLWAMFLKCSLLEMIGEYAAAMVLIEECITHTPTAPDMVAKKARLFKRMGDYKAAAVFMDSCRKLDLQDRYLNNKATKYFLAADRIEDAMDTIALFTKHDGDPQQILYDLQCNWYENCAGDAYFRRHEVGNALKKYLATEKHFNDYIEDLFDFHQFCIRKATLRSYVDVVRMVDKVYCHKYFQRAAKGAVIAYLSLLDYPAGLTSSSGVENTGAKEKEAVGSETVGTTEGEGDLSHLTAAERKKLRAKLRKQEKKKESGAAKNAANDGNDDSEKKAPFEEDSAIKEILSKNPLDEAARLCAELVKLPAADAASHAAACEVYLRRKKYALALRSLVCGLAKEKHHPDLTRLVVVFAKQVKGQDGNLGVNLSEMINEVVAQDLDLLLSGLSINSFVSAYVDISMIASLAHRIAAAQCLQVLGSVDWKSKAVELIVDPAVWEGRGVTVKNAAKALDVLRDEIKADEVVVEAFRQSCVACFPLANVFGGGVDLIQLGDLAFLPKDADEE